MELIFEVDFIMEHTAIYLGTCKRAILSQSHRRPVSEARHIAIYLCAHHCNVKYGVIADWFGRDRSIIYYAITTVTGLMAVDKDFKKKIDMTKRHLMTMLVLSGEHPSVELELVKQTVSND